MSSDLKAVIFIISRPSFSAIIVPYGKAPDEQIEDHEYWVGKIKEIRSRNGDPSEVGPDVFANLEC